jgi:hypothetical protein
VEGQTRRGRLVSRRTARILLAGVITLLGILIAPDDGDRLIYGQEYIDFAIGLQTTILSEEVQRRMVRTLALLEQAEARGRIRKGDAHLVFGSILASGQRYFIGTVKQSNASSVEVALFQTGERRTVRVLPNTLLRRGDKAIQAGELRDGELVEVISMDGLSAYSIIGFWVKP